MVLISQLMNKKTATWARKMLTRIFWVQIESFQSTSYRVIYLGFIALKQDCYSISWFSFLLTWLEKCLLHILLDVINIFKVFYCIAHMRRKKTCIFSFTQSMGEKYILYGADNFVNVSAKKNYQMRLILFVMSEFVIWVEKIILYVKMLLQRDKFS